MTTALSYANWYARALELLLSPQKPLGTALLQLLIAELEI